MGSQPSVSDFIAEVIQQDDVVIFSKSYCRHSKRAKEEFTKIGQQFRAIELDHRSDGNAIFDQLLEMTGARTVPRVFIKGRFVGGADDIVRLAGNGELTRLLAN